MTYAYSARYHKACAINISLVNLKCRTKTLLPGSHLALSGPSLTDKILAYAFGECSLLGCASHREYSTRVLHVMSLEDATTKVLQLGMASETSLAADAYHVAAVTNTTTSTLCQDKRHQILIYDQATDESWTWDCTSSVYTFRTPESDDIETYMRDWNFRICAKSRTVTFCGSCSEYDFDFDKLGPAVTDGYVTYVLRIVQHTYDGSLISKTDKQIMVDCLWRHRPATIGPYDLRRAGSADLWALGIFNASERKCVAVVDFGSGVSCKTPLQGDIQRIMVWKYMRYELVQPCKLRIYRTNSRETKDEQLVRQLYLPPLLGIVWDNECPALVAVSDSHLVIHSHDYRYMVLTFEEREFWSAESVHKKDWFQTSEWPGRVYRNNFKWTPTSTV